MSLKFHESPWFIPRWVGQELSKYRRTCGMLGPVNKHLAGPLPRFTQLDSFTRLRVIKRPSSSLSLGEQVLSRMLERSRAAAALMFNSRGFSFSRECIEVDDRVNSTCSTRTSAHRATSALRNTDRRWTLCCESSLTLCCPMSRSCLVSGCAGLELECL